MAKESPIIEEVLPRLKFIRSKKQEYFVCFSLDASGKVISRRVVSIGTVNATLAHPREVFAGPLKDRASWVIVAHNHPAGDPIPSSWDRKTTEQLVSAGILLGISVWDHVIVAKTGQYSFRERGWII